MTQRDSTLRFTGAAQSYREYRPGYPSDVFGVLFAGMGDVAELAVADIGAGTGISAQLLAARVARVYAVEPNAAMRAQADPLPNVMWSGGAAETTGLEDKSVDLALAFQAFHWFDASSAYAEFERIARKRIGLVQYERDERDAFTHAYGEIVRRYATDDTEALRAQTLDRFSGLAGVSLRRQAVPSAQPLTEDGLIGRASSASYLPRTGAQADELRSELRALFRAHGRHDSVTMHVHVHVLFADIA